MTETSLSKNLGRIQSHWAETVYIPNGGVLSLLAAAALALLGHALGKN